MNILQNVFDCDKEVLDPIELVPVPILGGLGSFSDRIWHKLSLGYKVVLRDRTGQGLQVSMLTSAHISAADYNWLVSSFLECFKLKVCVLKLSPLSTASQNG